MSAIDRTFMLMAIAVTLVAPVDAARAATAAHIDVGVNMALRALYASCPGARAVRSKAKAILVFPRVVDKPPASGGFGGDGALRQGGMTTGYYQTLSSSPSGVESFALALFFLSDAALESLRTSHDWEIGPDVVVLDQTSASRLSTASVRDDIYAFVFNEKGLMSGIGIRGAKITRLHPGK